LVLLLLLSLSTASSMSSTTIGHTSLEHLTIRQYLSLATELLSSLGPQPDGPANQTAAAINASILLGDKMVRVSIGALAFTEDTIQTLEVFALQANQTITSMLQAAIAYNASNKDTQYRERFDSLHDKLQNNWESENQSASQIDPKLRAMEASLVEALQSWQGILKGCNLLPSEKDLISNITYDKQQLDDCGTTSCIAYWTKKLATDAGLLAARLLCNPFLNLTTDLVATIDNIGVIVELILRVQSSQTLWLINDRVVEVLNQDIEPLPLFKAVARDWFTAATLIPTQVQGIIHSCQVTSEFVG